MAFEGLTQKLGAVFAKLKKKGKLNEQDITAAMREVRMALLEADVNYKVAKEFADNLSKRALGVEVMKSLTPAQMVIKIVNDELVTLMGGTMTEIKLSTKQRNVFMLCGLQGSGKTTHAAKIAKYYRKKGHRPLLVACDIYRPAAIDQLKTVGGAVGVPVFEKGTQDPVKTAKQAFEHARDHGNDIVILDTAGRLHIDEQLMDELKRIKKQCDVTETLLVVDAMTGQDAVNVAQSFNGEIGIDGVIVTKLDGDTRGGAALSVKAVTGKPIIFAGVGEKLDDLELFYPERMASRILGMGDVMTFVEKAQEEFDAEKAAEAAKKLRSSTFNMSDLLEQLRSLSKLGGMQQVMNMLPSDMRASVSEKDNEKQLKKTEAMILSMTVGEREKPSIITPSRKRRIAAGSGTRVEDVNRLLKQFEQMNKMMKKFSSAQKGKHGRRMPGFPF